MARNKPDWAEKETLKDINFADLVDYKTQKSTLILKNKWLCFSIIWLVSFLADLIDHS